MKKKVRLFIIVILSFTMCGCGKKVKHSIDDFVQNPAAAITKTESGTLSSNNSITEYPTVNKEEFSAEEIVEIAPPEEISAETAMANLPIELITKTGATLTSSLPLTVTVYEKASDAIASPISLTLTDTNGTLNFSCVSKTEEYKIEELSSGTIIETNSHAFNSRVTAIGDIYTFSVFLNNPSDLDLVHIIYELKIADSNDNDSTFYFAFEVKKFTPE